MHIVRWAAGLWLVVVGGSVLSMAYAGGRLDKYRDPVAAKLADIQQGATPPNVHVTLDSHWEIRSVAGYAQDKKSKSPEVCFLIAANDSSFLRALHANDSGSPAEAMRAAAIPTPVLVVTKRYESVGDVPNSDGPAGPVTGVVHTAHEACEKVISELGIGERDYLVIQEGEKFAPFRVPFVPFALLGFLLVLVSPVPIVWARRVDRLALQSAPAATSFGPSLSIAPQPFSLNATSGPPASLGVPAASHYPPPGSVPPPELDLSPGASVIVRRGAQRLPALVVRVEGGRCRCEFPDGQQAWVLFHDIRNA